MGVHDFKYNKVPFFARKPGNINTLWYFSTFFARKPGNISTLWYFDVCSPKTSSCASKPLLLLCNLVLPQCMYQVSLGLKEVQMGVHDFKYNKVPIFAKKNQGISILRCLLPRN